MSTDAELVPESGHQHVFLGSGHSANERKAWAVIALCSAMMLIEIGGGMLFGSLALIADGLHMSTHAIAMLIAALAYTFARKHSADLRFSFGTGKLGDLAGFTSAIVLALIALLIGYEAVTRFLAPVHIDFQEAIPIAVLGLIVNIVSAWLLSGGDDHHGHSDRHAHGHSDTEPTGDQDDGPDMQDPHSVDTRFGRVTMEIFEEQGPARFRLRATDWRSVDPSSLRVTIETIRPDSTRAKFPLAWRDGYFESDEVVPEPHEFAARVAMVGNDGSETYSLDFVEHHDHTGHGAHRDHNLRAAFIHVAADAAVSVLAILGLLAAKYLGWLWMDPMMGIVGMVVIAAWAYALVRDTGRILLDMTPDTALAKRIRERVEVDGDRVTDLHVWRLGPGHLGAIVSIVTTTARDGSFYRSRLRNFSNLSHVTIEVVSRPRRTAAA